MAEVSATLRTPLHGRHVQHGARFAANHGWQVPACYSSVEEETAAVRTGVGLADISHHAKFNVVGPGVSSVTRALRRDESLVPRRALPLDDHPIAVACRLTDESLLLLSAETDPSSLGNLIARQMTNQRDAKLWMHSDVTCAYAGFQLVGPNADRVLGALSHFDLRAVSFPASSCAETSLAGVYALLVRHPEFTLPSVRIYVAWDLAEYVWEMVMEAGKSCRIKPLGQESLTPLLAR